MSCELHVKDIPVTVSVPGGSELVMFTTPAGTTVLRTWASIVAGLYPPDFEGFVVASGSNTNQVVNGNGIVILTNFIGRRIRVYRGSVPQSALLGQFTWNPGTGELTLVPVPSTGEHFQIQAY